MEKEKKSIFLKIIIVGDSSVGKTSVLNRYLSGDFENETEVTIGYDYKWKTIIENNQKMKTDIKNLREEKEEFEE